MALFLSRRERQLWLFALCYTLAIYLMLYWLRPVTEFLRDRNLLRLAVASVFAVAAGAVVYLVLKRRPGRWQWSTLAVIGLAYLAILPITRSPEEKIHLVQYGLLGAVLYGALLERRRAATAGRPAGELPPRRLPLPLRRPAWAAFLLAVALGWIDEGIQWLLPNRFYDNFDVALNAVSAGLAIVAIAALAWAERRDRPAVVPDG